MAQLNNFNGGLNVRLAPNLINLNEAQIYTNIDNSRGSLKPIKEDTNENLSIGSYFYNFNDTWISSNSFKTYSEFQNRLYYSDNINIPQKTSDGINWYNLGIAKPGAKPIITNNSGIITGTVQYCYTYYNLDDGTESPPSLYSNELVVENASINISVLASSDKQVDYIRIYRIGGNLNAMQLVIELPNISTTYNDNIAEVDILGDTLNSFQYQQAPKGLCYLTEANSMFFGSIDDKLYYSDIGFVNYWSTFNFIEFDDTITGIGATASGLLVFTKYKTYIITGTSPLILSKYLLSGNQGCLSHRTICSSSNSLVWLSSDGICTSSGGDITIISRDKLNKLNLSNITDAIIYDDTYYLGYEDGMLVADFRFGMVFKNINTKVEGLCNYDNTLYYSYSGNLYSANTNDSYKTLSYKSPKLSDDQISNLKNYKSVYITCIGDLNINIYINSQLVITKDINSITNEILIPQHKRLGYCIEFELFGKGELLEIQYIVEGRQNGR